MQILILNLQKVYVTVSMSKHAGWVANNIGPDQTLRSVASDLCLYNLRRLVCPNTYPILLHIEVSGNGLGKWQTVQTLFRRRVMWHLK